MKKFFTLLSMVMLSMTALAGTDNGTITTGRLNEGAMVADDS